MKQGGSYRGAFSLNKMSISTSLSASFCLTSSSVSLSRALPSPSVKWRSNCHLGRHHGRPIFCCSRRESDSDGTQIDLSKTSDSLERTTPTRSSRRYYLKLVGRGLSTGFSSSSTTLFCIMGNHYARTGSIDLLSCIIEATGLCRGKYALDLVLKSSSAAVLVAFLNFSGTRPDYLGVQKNPPSLALCPRTPTCISTSEELNDPAHYVPPWSYNPPDGRGRRNPASKEKAYAELVEVVQKTKPDNYTPRIVEMTDDYLYVEYESPFPLLKLVDDVEFWFPPGNRSIVEYRSASRVGQSDFDANRKRIRALRQALEKKGWESVGY